MDREKIVDKETKKKILLFARLLQTSGIDVDKIILYGSHATGKATKESDIDLCVVSSVFKKNPDDYFRKIWQLAAKIDPSLEPIPFTEKELSNPYSTLSAEINHSGIRIL